MRDVPHALSLSPFLSPALYHTWAPNHRMTTAQAAPPGRKVRPKRR